MRAGRPVSARSTRMAPPQGNRILDVNRLPWPTHPLDRDGWVFEGMPARIRSIKRIRHNSDILLKH